MELKAPDLHCEDWERWAELCEELVQKCENELPDRAAEFADSVGTKLGDIGDTIRRTNRITEGQRGAITRMEEGIGKWLRGRG